MQICDFLLVDVNHFRERFFESSSADGNVGRSHKVAFIQVQKKKGGSIYFWQLFFRQCSNLVRNSFAARFHLIGSATTTMTTTLTRRSSKKKKNKSSTSNKISLE